MINNKCSHEVIARTTSPNFVVRRFNGFYIYVFHTKYHDKNRSVISGIMVEADGPTYTT